MLDKALVLVFMNRILKLLLSFVLILSGIPFLSAADSNSLLQHIFVEIRPTGYSIINKSGWHASVSWEGITAGGNYFENSAYIPNGMANTNTSRGGPVRSLNILAMINLVRDTNPPLVYIKGASKRTISSSRMKLTGRAKDHSRLTGLAWKQTGSGWKNIPIAYGAESKAYQLKLKLKRGTNKIGIRAIGASGVTRTKSIKVTRK